VRSLGGGGLGTVNVTWALLSQSTAHQLKSALPFVVRITDKSFSIWVAGGAAESETAVFGPGEVPCPPLFNVIPSECQYQGSRLHEDVGM